MKREQLEQILLDVQKPAQYIGGELNSIMKDKEKVDCRLAFCFPDKYEVGMSHLGMKILYSLYNERENWWCERVFAPDADMEQLMREKNIPLYGLESLDPIRDFDFILFSMQYEMSYTAILNMLDLAGVPVRSKDRTALAPMVVGILSKTVCCTVHQHRSRPLDAGDSARLSARLPLLSGGLYLSSAARQAL